jgi:hypothetical protein
MAKLNIRHEITSNLKEVHVMKKTLILLLSFTGAMLFVNISFAPFLLPIVFAHCDTLDDPVVSTAKAALEKGDVAPVLKWVKKANETEIRALFKKTLTQSEAKGKRLKNSQTCISWKHSSGCTVQARGNLILA